MPNSTNRRFALRVALVGTAILSILFLADALWTIFFAVTVAYVLFPLRERIARYGLSPSASAAITALIAFTTLLLVLLPIVIVLYVRLDSFIIVINGIPDSIPLQIFGFEYVLESGVLIEYSISFLQSLAPGIARTAPVILLKVVVFVFLVPALLLRPDALRNGMLSAVPRQYHDVTLALHERARKTLFSLYGLQAATAVGTFVLAVPVFLLLGYDAPFTLAVIAGLLQFIPVVGPSFLAALLGAYELSLGNTGGAVAIAVLGIIVLGVLPDAIIRPLLSQWTVKLPPSLYIVGFAGGILTVGAVGIIIGPLLVALLVEVVKLLAEVSQTRQTTPLAGDSGAEEDVP